MVRARAEVVVVVCTAAAVVVVRAALVVVTTRWATLVSASTSVSSTSSSSSKVSDVAAVATGATTDEVACSKLEVLVPATKALWPKPEVCEIAVTFLSFKPPREATVGSEEDDLGRVKW